MYRDRVTSDEGVASDELVERRVERMPWSPAQMIAILVGAASVILGVVALVRTGLDFDHLFTPEVSVAGLHQTPLLAIIEVAFGLLLVMAGAIPGGARGSMVFLGVVALGFGIVILADDGSMHRALGVHDEHGWIYLAVGALVTFAAMTAPVVWGRDRQAIGRRRRDRELLLHH